MLEVKNLSKSYGTRQVLQNINFHLNREVLGILGPNGAGKSTLLKIICDLIRPSQGYINLKNLHRNQIATIFEDQRFLSGFSGLKNIKIFTQAFTDAKKRDWPKVFASYGLFENRNVKYKFYSSGMKRRLDLMSIFLENKFLFLLDEPTNALDIDSIIAFSDQILSLKNEGKAFIISSHHAGELEKICDRFLIMNNGRILTELNKEEVISQYGTLENAYLSILSTNTLN